MKLLHRLRYIVEVCFPPTPLPQYLLDVITVVIRHSVYAATQVSMLNTGFKNIYLHYGLFVCLFACRCIVVLV